MFREMRRRKQLLEPERAHQILKDAPSGVLAVLGDDGYPYTVPLSYVLEGDVLYFHCAKTGHKLDAISQHEKVSFCVVEKDDVVANEFTTYFRSVVAFGRAQQVNDDDEKLKAIRLFNTKYAPGFPQEGEKEITREWNILTVVKVQIEHMTGKESIELVQQRQAGK